MKEVVRLPDNLRITAPVTPNESVSRPSHAAEPPQILPTDPNRVPGNGNQTDNPGYQTGDLLLNRGSVFGQFLEQLSSTPDLSKSLQGFLLDAMARQESIAARQPADAPLRTLLSSIPMEAEQAAESLKFQQQNATQFGGPLFRLLGQISEQSSNAGFDLRLADFLKAFSGYFSRQSTTQSIFANLEQIRGEVPLPYAKKLQEAMRSLGGKAETGGDPPESTGGLKEEPSALYAGGTKGGLSPSYAEKPQEAAHAPGWEYEVGARPAQGNLNAPKEIGDRQTEENLNVLKKDVIPFLAKYTAQTNDYGKTRDDVSMLLHNTAILNVSTRENLEDRFDQLFRYCKYSLNLPDATINLMRSLFGEEIAARRSGKDDAFYSALVKLLSSPGGTAGADHAVLHDITRSVLLDNSVYMPFQHIFLPVNLDGRFLFAQMWIEKREEDDDAHGPGGTAQPTSVYLTFDIQDLGYFEAAVHILDRRVDLSLSYPPALDRFRGTIRSELASILENNGLGAEKVQVSPCAAARIPQIVREKIEERRNSVNVSV